ncbi:MAG TPA: acyl-CoA dehydrogenase family protein [Aggregicoccus sp.]|nr:acyl-CoA dehydrogenase family protein [Aggregicoccus sp.]
MSAQTHAVFNQVPDLADYNLFTTDPTLQRALAHYGAGWHQEALVRYGARLGEAQTLALGALANQHPPTLVTHSRTGERIDRVEFHPSWHALLTLLRSEGLHALPFSHPRPGAWVARTAAYYLQGQVEAGSLCPTTMTFASIPVLRAEGALFADFLPKLYSNVHDPRDLPWREKVSAMVGMGMTEKQGGSDVRSNTTVALPVGSGGRGQEYRLTGHKWFLSAPMCDAHLVVARIGGEQGPLSCFFVPRFRDDGSKNPALLQRLKDKLGNRSNSSSEVEFRDTTGLLIGEEGRGIPTIIEMANHTRLDCVLGSSALIRQALVQAIHHTRHRSAFGKRLADQPLMRGVLADMALESEAASLLMMHLSDAFERVAGGGTADGAAGLAQAYRRVVTPAAKFWVCKRAIEVTGEAMEVWGGNGYVEEGPMARLYREAPVNSIWEGSGNVMCLDVLRALQREPAAARLLMEDLLSTASAEPRLRTALSELQRLLQLSPEQLEASARRFAQTLVLCVQAVLMLRHAPREHAEAFIASRFDAGHGRVLGTLPDLSPEAAARLVDASWA